MICRSPQFRVHAEKRKYGVVKTKGSSKVLKITKNYLFLENGFSFFGPMAGEKSMGVFVSAVQRPRTEHKDAVFAPPVRRR